MRSSIIKKKRKAVGVWHDKEKTFFDLIEWNRKWSLLADDSCVGRVHLNAHIKRFARELFPLNTALLFERDKRFALIVLTGSQSRERM